MTIPKGSWPRSLSFRWAFALFLSVLLGLYLWKSIRIEQDIVSSLEKSRPAEAAIFHKLKGSGFFQDQVFFRLEREDPELRAELIQKLKESAYELSQAFEPQIKDPSELYALLPFLPTSLQDKVLSQEHVERVREELRKLLSSPGGIGMVKLLAMDPLLLSREIPALMTGDKRSDEVVPIVAKRSGDIDWEKVRTLYTWVKTKDKDLSFVAGDFFALENYDAVQHDIMLCSVFSLIASLVIFRFFCKQWSLLFFLATGTGFSALVGLAVTQAVDGALYGLILAFASTFVSFNNETLVHLAGIDLKSNKKPLIGVFSALGTTIIGFLVLLFSSSHLTRQLAILSLASLLGFTLFLILFFDRLKTVEFKPIRLPQVVWSKKALAAAFILCLGLMAVLPKPGYKTNLEDFRYASDYLEEQTKIFSRKLASYSFEALEALPIPSERNTYDFYQELLAKDLVDKEVFHPIAYYRSLADQEAVRPKLEERIKQQTEALNKMFADEGLAIKVRSDSWLPAFEIKPYLKLWEKIWPLPWYSEEHGQGYLLVFHAKDRPIAGGIPMHPKAFYEQVLSELTANLGNLFLLGLVAMLLYLVPWQKRWDRIVMIFLPLFLAALCLQIFFHLSHRSISIVQIMGLALVISVALDYASVLVSNEHDPKDQGKVVLTGGLTLASFGSLLLAQHPVLKELALVVFIGTAVAFVLALFTRMERDSESEG